MKIKYDLIAFAAFLLSVASLSFAGNAPAAPASTLEIIPRLFLTTNDIQRLRQQASLPELTAAYADLETKASKSVTRWQKAYPVMPQPRTTAELIAIGRRDNPIPEFKTLATAFTLHPTPELGQVLREQLLARIGARQIHHYWRDDGIHEGESAMQFMEAYDLAAGAGLLTDEDRRAVRDEMRQCAHFLEGWTLDNNFSQGYTEYYRSVYCLNFHVFASSMMSIIGMYWPDLPESADWLRQSQSQLPELLFTEFGVDGGYGEGSAHYWACSFRPIFQFMIASRNLGVRDYFSDPAITDAVRRTLAWRMALTAPDGRNVAVGDSDRDSLGAEYLMQAGVELHEPEFVWAGRTIAQRARNDWIPTEPYDLFYYEMAAPAEAPTTLFNNFPFSGYAFFRSGWGSLDNFFMLKYGTTYIGRRENEQRLIISGHAHADALEMELHYHGIPMLVDPGRLGRYQDYLTYGGYCKATVAHNTVGLGNPWGYNRLDGRYAEHVRAHGQEFLYEVSQNNIGRADTHLVAVGDVGQMGIISAKLQTYERVTQQRTVVWFRDSGVAVVHDRMESDQEQPYEWYLNPIGKLLTEGSPLTFGDDTARMEVVPILPKKVNFQIVNGGDSNVPPYYVSLCAKPVASAMTNHPYAVEDRWGQYTLLVEQSKAKQTTFLNVLVPYNATNAPFKTSALGSEGIKLTGADSTLLVAAGNNDGSGLLVTGDFGVARLDHNELASYALQHGHKLKLGNEELIKVALLSQPWEPFFDSAVTAAVSLPDHRASFSFPPSPSDRQLVMFNPKLTPGLEQPLPISVAVSFRVSQKPARIIALRSDIRSPDLDDSTFDRKTTPWANDPHQGHYLREQLNFQYDEISKLVTVQMDTGIRQLIWQ